MAPPYSNNGNSYGSSYSSRPYNNGHQHRQPFGSDSGSTSLFEDMRAIIANASRLSWRFWNERGRRMLLDALLSSARRLRRNLTVRRIFSFPHLLVAIWVVLLLWGERWVFHSEIEDCHWDKWENWPPGADPHHLIFVADPQLIDPHSYPGRPWPLNPLTYLITDNFMRRSYAELQGQFSPDTVFFLGDLFDGGREWKTAHGSFKDPEWGPHPEDEQKHLKRWNRKYGEAYWLREYARFGDIFLGPWVKAGALPDAGQKRRKLIATLPGNHDLGFGAEVKIPVRNRFEAYFGEGNRVDVVGNHTFVSVDTVSMSAASSEVAGRHNVENIFKPTEHFLNDAKWAKQRAVEKELRFLRGETLEPRYNHKIEDLEKADFKDRPSSGDGAPELPTILLTHVPLHRPKGTPCGPLREHWPPTKPPAGQTEPVFPDHRNAITVARGYQYQNVLGEEDSEKLVEKVGNVVHAFSGDDHDYCELTHSPKQGSVPEITVKSFSMAMGVPTPGFQMVSLYNPVDADGKPLGEAGKPTLQTHLCLLPAPLAIYFKYIYFGLSCVAVLALRAFLVPALRLSRFALDPEPAGTAGNSPVLPIFKAKMDDYDSEYGSPATGFSASRYRESGSGSHTRDRSGSFTPGVAKAQAARGASPSAAGEGKKAHKHHHHHQKNSGVGGGKWGWAAAAGGGGGHRGGGPKIEILGENEDFNYGGKWKAASRTKPRAVATVSVVVTEFWTTLWRVVWMAVGFYGWLNWRG
ncbi:hypothetical protein B0T17DRAFT_536803 [Bombardia bombarda]|uniref:Calcineurin-like phosphoesterase domain-containing protein n=1 Tax=Bombardia bombarda TaxID=252184 RepID=A0AA40BYB4_9PEZI|nr:hypothetical protein B0T17DRAFT_536803 [Bombardia bombarda]